MEIAFEKLTEDAVIPTRSSKGSAGYDFVSTVDFKIYPGGTVTFFTDIRAKMPENVFLKLQVRNSIGNIKNLRLVNVEGIIDSDYYGNPKTHGNIGISLYNFGTGIQEVRKGDKIVQGIFQEYLRTSSDSASNQREGGSFWNEQ